LVPTPAYTTLPHSVLLMIGTNDLCATGGQAEMPKRLGNLLDKITSTAPDTLLVVAKTIPWVKPTDYSGLIKTYNDAIPGLVQTRANCGKHVILVDMNTAFDLSTMMSSDNCHPNTAGYTFMAHQWYAAIESLLSK
jgi:lysophospholipase L1-like esterase